MFDHDQIMADLNQLWDLLNYGNYLTWILNALVGYIAYLVGRRFFASRKEGPEVDG